MDVQNEDVEQEITRLLQCLQSDPEQRTELWERLLGLIYGELRALAHHQRAKFNDHAPAQLHTTELVHELYARLDRQLSQGTKFPQHRSHFFALAARAMRQLIIDTIRHEKSAKRGGDAPHMALESNMMSTWFDAQQTERFVDIHHALARLEQINDQHVRLVECHIFLGLTLDEVADLESVSLSTIKRRWRMARAWLSTALHA